MCLMILGAQENALRGYFPEGYGCGDGGDDG